MRPVLGVWVDGALHTTSSPAARKARNLAEDDRFVKMLLTEARRPARTGRHGDVPGD